MPALVLVRGRTLAAGPRPARDLRGLLDRGIEAAEVITLEALVTPDNVNI